MRFATATAAPAVCSVLLLGWSSHAFSPSTHASRMPATTISSSYSSSAEAASSSALFASGSSGGRRASSASNAIAKARARREAKARQAATASTTNKRPADQSNASGAAASAPNVSAASTSTSANILDEAMQQSRDTILGRDGEHFAFDRIGGKVEFGSTAELVTPLDTGGLEPSAESVGLWLSDARRVAGGLWDEDLLTDLGQCTYRLGLMPLKFVTIELAPTVDVKMWTDGTTSADTDAGAVPTFRLHSIGFEPNVTLLPGVGLDAKSLGIEIEVCGELRPTADGKGCEGAIGFVSRGELPPPMRVLPDSVISAAGATISKTVRDFAVANFQAGAVKQYRAYCVEEQDSLAAAESSTGSVVPK